MRLAESAQFMVLARQSPMVQFPSATLTLLGEGDPYKNPYIVLIHIFLLK